MTKTAASASAARINEAVIGRKLDEVANRGHRPQADKAASYSGDASVAQAESLACQQRRQIGSAEPRPPRMACLTCASPHRK